jgi:hypothetical protein
MRLLLLGRLFAHETYRLSESIQSFISPNRELVETLPLVGKRAVASRGSVGAGVRGFLASGCVTSSCTPFVEFPPWTTRFDIRTLHI